MVIRKVKKSVRKENRKVQDRHEGRNGARKSEREKERSINMVSGNKNLLTNILSAKLKIWKIIIWHASIDKQTLDIIQSGVQSS